MKAKEQSKFRILAIESSCDETSASIIEAKLKVKSRKLKVIENIEIVNNIISSQVKLHATYGGVYPELASREHIRNIIPVIQEAINEASNNSESSIEKLVSSINTKSKILNTNFQIQTSDFDAIAVTTGPGLIGSLLVGVNTAKTLAYTLNKPIYAINHLEGHVYSCFTGKFSIYNSQFSNKPQIQNSKINSLNENCKLKTENSIPQFPLVALVVSGGHTSLVLMKDHLNYQTIGETLDDAAGEVFDKVARMLDLGYPGGPAISALAEKFSIYNSQFSNKSQISNSNFQDPKKLQATSYKLIKFPRPMINENNFDFSFSGLKTAVLYTVKRLKETNQPFDHTQGKPINKLTKQLICYEFQEAVVETLVTKTFRAAQKYKAKSILLCGGVSSNSRLREQFTKKLQATSYKLNFFVPQKNLSTDNAAMIGIAAAYRVALCKKPTPWYDVNADPNLGLR